MKILQEGMGLEGKAGDFLAKAAEPPLSAAAEAAVVLLTDIGALGAETGAGGECGDRIGRESRRRGCSGRGVVLSHPARALSVRRPCACALLSLSQRTGSG